MHWCSLSMELIWILSGSLVVVNCLPLTDLPRNWIPNADDSENFASRSFYDSLARYFATKALLELSNHQPRPDDDHPRRTVQPGDFVEFTKSMTKRQQGWYNPYGKRGSEPVLSTSSEFRPASDYHFDPHVRSAIFDPSESGSYPHQDSNGEMTPKADETFDMRGKISAPGNDADERGEVLPSTNDVTAQDLAALKEKLRRLYRTFSPDDVINMRDTKENFHDFDYAPLLEKLNRVQQLGSS